MLETKIDLAEIYALETSLSNDTVVTSTPASITWTYLGIPQDVRGLRILDVASGANSLVSRLLKAGADAYGIDSAYTKPIDQIVEIAKKTAQQQAHQSGSLYKRMLDIQMEEIEAFQKSFIANPERYRPGFMTRINFPKNSFDWVVSNCGLIVLSENPDAMEVALHKFIEVAEPGGTVSITPWLTEEDYTYHTETAIDIYIEVFKKIEETNLGEMIVDYDILPESPLPISSFHRLRIIKK